ncbi:MAG: prepilin-type N-terminal cleavage/methylation domain-containing protein [Desulfobacteraceae bacterium]|nr:prepilin-type N-terminal cleavage/methylation domain-containing protein [Desulfobacteraceae bacterium]
MPKNHNKTIAVSGFTLIELIVSLVLLGIVVSIAGMGIVSGLNVFQASRENIHISQTASLALSRIHRELQEMVDVIGFESDDSSYIIFDTSSGKRQAIGNHDASIFLITQLGSTVETLVESDYRNARKIIGGVGRFRLEFNSGYTDGAAVEWDPNVHALEQLSTVKTEIGIKRSLTGLSDLSIHLITHPRNINSYGGASPAAVDTGSLEGPYCFIRHADPLHQFQIWPPALVMAVGCLLSFLCQPIPRKKLTHEKSGSVLIGVLAAMLLFSALGAALIQMVGSSSFGQAGVSLTTKTYYLAESGYRYAASQFLRAASKSEELGKLTELNGSDYQLSNQNLKFHLDVFAYFFVVNGDVTAGSTSMVTNVYGGLPPGLNDLYTTSPDGDNGFIFIDGIGSREYTSVSWNKAGEGQNHSGKLTFNFDSGLPNIQANTDISFALKTGGATQTLNRNGDLIYDPANNMAALFPDRNAEISVGGHVYTYSRIDRVNNKLIGVTDPKDVNMPSRQVQASTAIQLRNFVQLHSRGVYGSEADNPIVAREIRYYIPLPPSDASGEEKEFHERFDNDGLPAWNVLEGYGGPSDPQHQVESIDGDNALRVKSTDLAPATQAIESLITLKWDDPLVDMNLSDSLKFSGGFLSYNAQVKIGFQRDTRRPGHEFEEDDTDFPKYYGAGITFRLDPIDPGNLLAEGYNSYGISFLRANMFNGLESDPPGPYEYYDNIKDQLVPMYDDAGTGEEVDMNNENIIVLWSAKPGNNFNWMAYKKISKNIYMLEDADYGNWILAGDWSPTFNSYNNSTMHWYSGSTTTGTLTSPDIDLSIDRAGNALDDIGRPALEFLTYNRTLSSEKQIQIWDKTTNPAEKWDDLYSLDSNNTSGKWIIRRIDLNDYHDKTIKIRFKYTHQSGGEGWYIDDVRINWSWPVHNSGLLISVKEAASVAFENGQYEIYDGDIIIGGTSGATARVNGPAILKSGTWGDTTTPAEGILTITNLKPTSSTFNDGESIFVLGQSLAATVKTGGFRARDNFLKAYYGSQAGFGIANSDPLDSERLAYPRNPSALEWPGKDERRWAAEKDFFRLIQWDAVNNTDFVANSFSAIMTKDDISLINPVDYPRTIVRSNTWVTDPDTFPELVIKTNKASLNRPELGLHTFGKGSTSVYFDDFGLNALFQADPKITTPPIQE